MRETVVPPEGFEWVEWEPEMRCAACGLRFSCIAPSVAILQTLYNAMADEHRGQCPGA